MNLECTSAKFNDFGLIRLVGMYYDSNLNQTFVKVDIIDDDHLNKKSGHKLIQLGKV